MDRKLAEVDQTPPMLSNALLEETWETLIAIAMAAAICVGVVTLAAHLDTARPARATVANMEQTASGVPLNHATHQEMSRLN
jgi:hypothetical protein